MALKKLNNTSFIFVIHPAFSSLHMLNFLFTNTLCYTVRSMKLSPSPLRSRRIEAEEILRNLRRTDVSSSQVAGADGEGLLLLENCEVCSRVEFWWHGVEMKPEREF